MAQQFIQIHAAAPAQPRWGEPCNGCGVCCLLRPCPVGIVLSRRLKGPCAALRWDESATRYLCSALGDFRSPDAPDKGDDSARWSERLRRSVARRLIAAGEGCDCDAELDSD